jgi:hypothetical protein
MTYKIKKRKIKIKNLIIPFLYPEPEPMRRRRRATGSQINFMMFKKQKVKAHYKPSPFCTRSRAFLRTIYKGFGVNLAG